MNTPFDWPVGVARMRRLPSTPLGVQSDELPRSMFSLVIAYVEVLKLCVSVDRYPPASRCELVAQVAKAPAVIRPSAMRPTNTPKTSDTTRPAVQPGRQFCGGAIGPPGGPPYGGAPYGAW